MHPRKTSRGRPANKTVLAPIGVQLGVTSRNEKNCTLRRLAASGVEELLNDLNQDPLVAEEEPEEEEPDEEKVAVATPNKRRRSAKKKRRA